MEVRERIGSAGDPFAVAEGARPGGEGCMGTPRTLTKEQVRFWEENGYLVLPEVLSPQEVERLRRAVDDLEARAATVGETTDRFQFKVFESAGRRVQQIAEPHELGGEWLALARHPAILDRVEDLLGPNLQLYYSMGMLKAPREGFAAPWHQDFAFFPHGRTEILACMVAIDDATPENGCLRVVPGSHRMGILNHYKDGKFTGIYQGDTAAFDAPGGHALLPVRAGGLLLWHVMTLHGSAPNRSEHPRRAVVLEYKNPEARLLAGSFNSRMEVRSMGLMVRGRDPSGELLSAG
jgi:ectoine hydroxylase-related dioxygenase (phytanoyl-CoA dioxygenase family)